MHWVRTLWCPRKTREVEFEGLDESLEVGGGGGRWEGSSDGWALGREAGGAAPEARSPRVGTDVEREEWPGRQVEMQV